MLLVDLFYVQCVPFILGMLEPLQMRFVEHLSESTLGAKCMEQCTEMLKRMVATAKAYRLDVKGIESDGESALKKLEEKSTQKLGVPVGVCEGSHIGIVESEIRVVKERQRSCSILPFLLCLVIPLDVSAPLKFFSTSIIATSHYCMHIVNIACTSTSNRHRL